MSYLMTKIYSIVRRKNSIMLYLDRSPGYTIASSSLYEIMFEDKKVIAPIANGNTVKAFKFLVEKTKKNYWVNNLTERNVLKINSIPEQTPVDFNPTEQDVFFAVNEGLAPFLSYFTEPEFVVPSEFVLQIDNLNDLYDTHILFNIFNETNIKIYITGDVSKTDRGYIESNDKFKNIIKFGSAISYLPTNKRVFTCADNKTVFTKMQEREIIYTDILPKS